MNRRAAEVAAGKGDRSRQAVVGNALAGDDSHASLRASLQSSDPAATSAARRFHKEFAK